MSLAFPWLPGRRRASADPAAFAGFLARQGAYVAQKTVFDYCRVKAGRQERALFADPAFLAALHHCRWQTFHWTMLDMAAMAESWLRPHVPRGAEPALAAALVPLHARALSLAGPPPEEERAAAEAARQALPGHLAALQLAPPQPANRLRLLAEAPLLATLPIHPDRRRGETPAIKGALRFLVVSAQQEMERRFAPGPLAAALLHDRPP
ncbi:hypothetical protein [Caldovatus aquaticus]|uniref:Uncharacterized protein n=1 Tax=Caldovatus aquaticus TaxID=2865671 RepID=A0ABS7F3K3_9PROT|nr:hypothetical protein [Caldovatus aquaticus]MBW8269878.1 hypothetical protein [Caldovatus aquaticus]